MAYKNTDQYTDLIHAGSNVSIDPPGTINATDKLVTPFEIKHNGETVAEIENNGDLRLEGTVYINGDTDVQEITPIFTADIIGDYTLNTFTSSEGFDDLIEALETGHTLIARDANGFVYQQTAGELGEAVTDTLYFACVQSDGIYILTWTAESRIISLVPVAAGDATKLHIYSYTNQTQNEILSWLESAYAIDGNEGQYLISVIIRPSNYVAFNAIGKATRQPNTTRWYLDISYVDSDGIHTSYREITGATTLDYYWRTIYNPTEREIPLFYHDGATQINSNATSAADNVVNGSRLRKAIRYISGNSKLYAPLPTIVYVENGNHHILTLSDNTGDYSNTYPATYIFRGTEAYSANTIVIYELTIAYTNASTYTATIITNTYTIGS